MKIYAMSDMHGFLAEFEQALSLVMEHLEEPDVMTSGYLPVLLVDTEKDAYYRVTEGGTWKILPYDMEN